MKIKEISKWTEDASERVKERLSAGEAVAILCDIPLVDEVELKKTDDGLLLGPACSFSIVERTGVGIWNEVGRGPVGLVGNSSSGLRALACMLSDIGISHAIHVGWRDFSQAVGGLGARRALRFLQEDPDTEYIAVLGTLPSQQVVRKLTRDVEGKKPLAFLFLDPAAKEHRTLEDFAREVAGLAGRRLDPDPPDEQMEVIAEREASKLAYGQKYVRGIFSGKFVCVEAQLILSRFGKTVYSNIPLKPRLKLPNPNASMGHTCVDISSPELSLGLNPIVDPKPYSERMIREAKDEQIGALVFDVVLGHGACPDPASVFSEAVAKAREICESTFGYLPAFAHVVGTERDPQNLRRQKKKLEEAGVILTSSTSRAVLLSAATAGFKP